eukprot:CAMPEP_0194212584 /NCGR_PEP_ID=MMETSP0156-20130528/12630_1 /TAXON_ID=33649 /ORGANISM="Thalassionema nitzschioides, Strain L26-B" /LENGTH=127 /DNA_ID=CAMNT_0038940449 /DNA_START=144 /DNA_END=527 /DNA_ORIENTATION=-
MKFPIAGLIQKVKRKHDQSSPESRANSALVQRAYFGIFDHDDAGSINLFLYEDDTETYSNDTQPTSTSSSECFDENEDLTNHNTHDVRQREADNDIPDCVLCPRGKEGSLISANVEKSLDLFENGEK